MADGYSCYRFQDFTLPVNQKEPRPSNSAKPLTLVPTRIQPYRTALIRLTTGRVFTRGKIRLENMAIAVGVSPRRWDRLADMVAARNREQRSGGFQARDVSKLESVDGGVRTDLFDKKKSLELR
jgi:hypothetical protein